MLAAKSPTIPPGNWYVLTYTLLSWPFPFTNNLLALKFTAAENGILNLYRCYLIYYMNLDTLSVYLHILLWESSAHCRSSFVRKSKKKFQVRSDAKIPTKISKKFVGKWAISRSELVRLSFLARFTMFTNIWVYWQSIAWQFAMQVEWCNKQNNNKAHTISIKITFLFK